MHRNRVRSQHSASLLGPLGLFLSSDIVEGNLKSIMRLVLALAAHFKPGSGRTVSQGRDAGAPLRTHQPHCATAVAQGAAAALADVCHDMSRSGRDVFRYRQR